MKLSKWIGVAIIAVAFAFAFTSGAEAGPIPYPGSGVENPITYTFTAVADGSIGAYFFSGGGASLENELTVLINGVLSGIQGLNNHTSAYGAFLDLGAVMAGDTIVFKMINLDGVVGPWYSDKALNSDGSNHIYSTDWAGDVTIPAGTYVAFEDLPSTGSDFNYNDLAFVFTNVKKTDSSVPVPGTLGLLLGALGLVGVTRRKR